MSALALGKERYLQKDNDVWARQLIVIVILK